MSILSLLDRLQESHLVKVNLGLVLIRILIHWWLFHSSSNWLIWRSESLADLMHHLLGDEGPRPIYFLANLEDLTTQDVLFLSYLSFVREIKLLLLTGMLMEPLSFQLFSPLLSMEESALPFILLVVQVKTLIRGYFVALMISWHVLHDVFERSVGIVIEGLGLEVVVPCPILLALVKLFEGHRQVS